MRLLKKFLFGLVYLSILVGVGFGSYFLFLKPAPSCFDEILNQDEEQIDCGGNCIPCELKNLEAQIGEAHVFALSESATSIAIRVSNPSVNYGASKFQYVVDIYGRNNSKLRTITGESYLYPNEEKYIVISGLNIDARLIERAEFSLEGEINWVVANMMSELPDIFIKDVDDNVENGLIVISGIVSNNSPLEIEDFSIYSVGIGFDGNVLSASSTLIDKLPPFSDKEFDIFMPAGRYARFETGIEFSE